MPFIQGQTFAEELESKRCIETEVKSIIRELLDIVLFL